VNVPSCPLLIIVRRPLLAPRHEFDIGVSSYNTFTERSDSFDASRKKRAERVPVVDGEVLEHPLDNPITRVDHQASVAHRNRHLPTT
jgi:hypothetical protein